MTVNANTVSDIIRKSNDARYIEIEGFEAAGKTTQSEILATALTDAGREVCLTREPGGTVFGALIRRLLLTEQQDALDERAEMLLFAADNAQHCQKVVLPALNEGYDVISDRGFGSALAYQGIGVGLGVEKVHEIYGWARRAVCPDLTILITHNLYEDAFDRFSDVTSEKGRDRIESRPNDYLNRVWNGYKELLETEENWVSINAGLSIQEVGANILNKVSHLFPNEIAQILMNKSADHLVSNS